MIEYGKNIAFNEDQIEILKEYLKEEWFIELNSKVNMYDETASIEMQIDHIRKYIMYFCNSDFQATEEDIENFFDLLSHYKTKTYREPIRDENGFIQIKKSGFNRGNAFYTSKTKSIIQGNGKGAFIDGILVTPDRKEYIKKLTMDAEGKLHGIEYRKQARYNGTVAHEVFEFFGEKSASYLPAIYVSPSYYVLSENFLESNQELINLNDFFKKSTENTHSDILRLLEDNIRIRYKNNLSDEEYNKLVTKLKMQYLKQAFVKKIIGLGDEKLENMGVVITTSGEEMDTPDINISPAFDLDMSFDLAEETKMRRIPTDDGQTDIKSFIKKFANYDGFRTFLEDVLSRIKNEEEVTETILDRAYEVSKVSYLKKEDTRANYKNYLKAKFKEVKQAYQEIYIHPERKEVNDEAEIVLE